VNDVLNAIGRLDPALARKIAAESVELGTNPSPESTSTRLRTASADFDNTKTIVDHLRVSPERFAPLDYGAAFHDLVGRRAFEGFMKNSPERSAAWEQTRALADPS